MKQYLAYVKSYAKRPSFLTLIIVIATLFISTIALGGMLFMTKQSLLAQQNEAKKKQEEIGKISKELDALQHQDQYVINKALEKTMKDIESTYKKSVETYEQILDLKANNVKTDKLDTQLAATMKLLSERNYASAEAKLTELAKQISTEQQKIAAVKIPEGTIDSNTPPGSGVQTQKVDTDAGTFLTTLIAADLNTTRVIVDTASDSDCSDNCPTLALSDYVSRNGAFAGINGSYFCPASYPNCAGKTNSFDLLVMNKNKHYFNAANNVYSTNPAVIFSNGSVRFVSQALEWGRDTSVDGVISNFPLLVAGGNTVYSDNPDPKFNSKGPRCFVASKGNTVYIGIVYNATMGDSARALKALGMENAMNLDEGGSTALWGNGRYLAGPGRAIPNAILFVRK